MKKSAPNKFKKQLPNILIILVFIIGLSVLLYPPISSYINAQTQSRSVARYYERVTEYDGEQLKKMIAEAREYNDNLLGKQNRFSFTEAETAYYKSILNIGPDIMGVLIIDKIDVNLPIYHGTDESVLQVGLGHLQGSSLPVGGVGTHAVISGHTGLPSAVLLTHLTKLVECDKFLIRIASEVLTYEVDKISVVEPGEVRALDIDPEADIVTLVTCTPYGINSHRLLVRGHRVENDINVEWELAAANPLPMVIMVLLFIAPVIPVAAVIVIIRCAKIKRGGKTSL